MKPVLLTEHETETPEGLPGPPPEGEHVLWHGQPSMHGLSRRAFHLRAVAIYFAIIIVWQIAVGVHDGRGTPEIVAGATWIALLAGIALSILWLLAYATRRSARYVITNRRIVMRVGVALPITINLPFARIAAADLRVERDGSGEVSVRLAPGERVAWALLWPHVRPWRLRSPEPTLRGLSDARAVAAVLTDALRLHAEQSGHSVVSPTAAAANDQQTHAPMPGRALATG